ncbi:MAG: iron ABC transporter permease [Planctomycetes bacterium]|nr:iron ABC transporter permease [Planctomycetota bacterium]
MNSPAPAPTSIKRYGLRLAVAAAGLAVLLIISPGVGVDSASYGWWDVWRARLGWEISQDELVGRPLADLNGDGVISAEERDGFVAVARTMFNLRFPRALLALQVGMTLALCGAVLQVLFRNPLATPYTLGIASGGALGALIALRLGWVVAVAGVSAIAASAFGGAILVVGLVFLIARGSGRLTSNELLLAGVTLGLFCSAMMMFVTAVSNERETFFIVRWMMGSLDAVRTIEGAMLLPMMLPAWIVLILFSRSLNQYRMGDELAAARGVNVSLLQGVCVGVCTLATAAVVAHCGPIGFVGLVVPHMVALVVGSDCRILLPASAIAGGAFLIICDWVSQLCMRVAGWVSGQQLGSATLPIGVVTAVVGVPIFLVLLRARRR